MRVVNTASFLIGRGLACIAALVALLLIAPASGAAAEGPRVVRRGMFMGLDPGLAVRFENDATPVYARLDLRLGGCLRSRLQFGVDWRMDLLAAGPVEVVERRHTIGPVLGFFLIRGWFARVYTHLGGFDPWFITAGGQSGYEWALGRFSAVGFVLGGDGDIPLDGAARVGFTVSAAFYLSAYDLLTRRGRDPGVD